MSDARPVPGATVRIRHAGTSDFMPARAEKCDERAITVSCDAGYDRSFTPGRDIAVEWTEDFAVHVVHGTIAAATLEGPRPRLAIRPTHPAETLQRRDDVRVRVELPFTAWTADDGAKGRKGTTVDVSGGGMLATGKALELEPGDEVEVELELPGQDPVELVAVVARIVKPSALGFRFVEISPGQRDRLIKHLFKVQSDQLARRAGARTS